jgi:phenylalanyl-tRNA synthetase beta chain
MKVPISWLKDFVEINIPLEELARKLTLAGLEVESILYVGLPMPAVKAGGGATQHDFSVSGIAWAVDKIVVASVSEVMPHPNADRLVLCKLFDGVQDHVILTGAPNLFPYKGIGPLEKPLKVAYAREGSQIYDGHQTVQVLTTLKRAKIRGFDSYSMICSEKELGISDDHEGVIILDEEAPVGAPLAEYMGDAVLDISILPNTARAASILGVAREVAALTGWRLKQSAVFSDASSVRGKFAEIEITRPELNPRFVLGLIEDVEIRPSPYWVQRRLKLAGMRPISNIVDATNYAMLEIGEPLHAFDYDVLVGRILNSPYKTPKIITRTARLGEKLTTLDGLERTLDEKAVLVCDTAGALSIAGIMGGAESEVSAKTRNILLEGAAWNFTNIRRTAKAQNLPSEASFRFSRGVHPAMAERGVRRGLELMHQWAGGSLAKGLVDNYPLPPAIPTIEITPEDVKRWLGIELGVGEIKQILESLEFHCELSPHAPRPTLLAVPPDHRLDIGDGVIGKADLLEEIARVYGYDRIPETRLADRLPPQRGNPSLEHEERIRDLLVKMGLQEVASYHMTSIEREARLHAGLPPTGYVKLVNPIASDRYVMRQSLLSSLMEVVERNTRVRPRMALFEIGPVFIAAEGVELPAEPQRLAIVLTGPRSISGWQKADTDAMGFYDLKGILASLLEALHVGQLAKSGEVGYGKPTYEPAAHPSFHPGKQAKIQVGEREVGIFGELHPNVRQNYDLLEAPLLAAELDLDALLPLIPDRYVSQPVPAYPPVLEDLALVVDEALPAERVAEVIRAAGGKIVTGVRLFDVYRGEKIGASKKSLAYSLTYQAPNKTLTDKDVAGIRTRIIRRLEQELGAVLRG